MNGHAKYMNLSWTKFSRLFLFKTQSVWVISSAFSGEQAIQARMDALDERKPVRITATTKVMSHPVTWLAWPTMVFHLRSILWKGAAEIVIGTR